MLEKRIIDLETTISFQENTIKELSDVMYEQQKEIDKLKEITEGILKQIGKQSSTTAEFNPIAEKPPHF